MLLVLLFYIGIGVRSLLVAFCVRRFYRQEYVRAWQLLRYSWLPAVFAEEEYWRPLYEARNSSFFRPAFGEWSKTLEQHMCFGACMLEALEDLCHGPGGLRLYSLRNGRGRLQLQKQQKMIWWLLPFAMLMTLMPALGSLSSFGSPYGPPWWFLALPLGMPLFIGGAYLGGQGPVLLLMRARIIALCEFLLDEPGLDVTALPPPEPDGSTARRRWIALHERVARALGWNPQG